MTQVSELGRSSLHVDSEAGSGPSQVDGSELPGPISKVEVPFITLDGRTTYVAVSTKRAEADESS